MYRFSFIVLLNQHPTHSLIKICLWLQKLATLHIFPIKDITLYCSWLFEIIFYCLLMNRSAHVYSSTRLPPCHVVILNDSAMCGALCLLTWRNWTATELFPITGAFSGTIALFVQEQKYKIR